MTSGPGYEVGVALQSPEGEGYDVTVIKEPTEGATAEGLITIYPAVIIGSGLPAAMRLLGHDPHGATFEHAIAGVGAEDSADVVVRAQGRRAPDDVPGYSTGHEAILSSAQAEWHLAVGSLRTYLNTDHSPAGSPEPA